jgi:hypothetical protein
MMEKRNNESTPVDTLNEIGVLKRREIEARILAPLLEAFGAEFGADRVREIARDVIVRIAHEQGMSLAEAQDSNALDAFAAATEAWRIGNSIEIDVLEENAERYSFNVMRCRYAELYRSLGIPELGAILSCNRDASLIEGFNPMIKLNRTQTIMQGAPFCDFRYALKTPDE